MLKKTITYTDYEGNKLTEDFYFNLTKTELAQMQMSKAGGYAEQLQRIVKAQDVPALAKIFNELILASYGVKSDDGKRFHKTTELAQEFTESPAYDVLFMELLGNEKAAADFFKGIIPSDLAKQVDEEQLKLKSEN